jgi:predicted dehydrogenase
VEQITRLRFVFENLVAESNPTPYRPTAEPWQIFPDTPEAGAAIEAALQHFQPLPEGFAGQFVGFSEALRTGSDFPVTMADARQALELLTAFFLSARTRQAVDLPILPDHPYYRGWLPED